MKRNLASIFPFLIAIFASCSEFQEVKLRNCDRIENIPGPEDIDIQSGRDYRLIVSSQDRRKMDPEGEALERGAIYYIPLKGRYIAYEFSIENRDDYPFHPHGIHVSRQANRDYLYVVNHGTSRQHSVELFEIKENALYFLARYRSFLLTSPNDVVGLGRDEFYVTNDRGASTSIGRWLETYLRLDYANVVHYRFGYWNVVANDMSLANGIQISDSKNYIYVAATGDEIVYEYERLENSLRLNRALEVPGGVDNLVWESNSELTVTSHPDILQFLRHANSSDIQSPTEIYRLNIQSGKYQKVYADSGGQISAGSVGVPARGKIFIGQVFEPRIVYCDYN